MLLRNIHTKCLLHGLVLWVYAREFHYRRRIIIIIAGLQCADIQGATEKNAHTFTRDKFGTVCQRLPLNEDFYTTIFYTDYSLPSNAKFV